MIGAGEVRLYAFEGDWTPARRLAEALEVGIGALRHHPFPDGESLVTVTGPIEARSIIYCSLNAPDSRLMPLLLGVDALRQGGARRVELVAPYMPYMRQDRVFAPGQPISAKVWGGILGAALDRVYTVDPHLHRIRDLAEVLGEGRGVMIPAAPALADFLRRRLRGAVLLGPDEESRSWVEAIAGGQLAYQIAHKERRGDFDVRITLASPAALENQRVVIIDDVASSGRTLAQCARVARAAGALGVDCVVTHAIFAGNALEVIEEAGVGSVWSTDSIVHATNRIPLSAHLASHLQQLWAAEVAAAAAAAADDDVQELEPGWEVDIDIDLEADVELA